MTERKTEILVGFVVSVAVLALTLGLIWGKGIALFSHRQYVKVQFFDVRGLEEGDPVVIRGMKQGEVERIDLEPECVNVKLRLDKKVRLYSDLSISLESKELMGGMQISIDPGTVGQPANLKLVYSGEIKGDLWTVLDMGNVVLAKTDSLLYRLNRLLADASLANTLHNLEQATEQAKVLLSENRQAIRLTAGRLNAMSRQLQEDSVAYQLGILVSKLDTTVSVFHSLARRIEDEEGTMGKLVRDRWLYDQLFGTVVRLDSLIADIKAHPKKYVRFSLF